MSLNTLENMVNWVDNNIKMNPTLEDMSSFVGYSPYYCSAKFHEYMGITFKQYIAKRKLKYATIDIKDTNKKILDIALEYGFSSQEAFTRAFVAAYGRTPYKYRKELINVCDS